MTGLAQGNTFGLYRERPLQLSIKINIFKGRSRPLCYISKHHLFFFLSTMSHLSSFPGLLIFCSLIKRLSGAGGITVLGTGSGPNPSTDFWLMRAKTFPPLNLSSCMMNACHTLCISCDRTRWCPAPT